MINDVDEFIRKAVNTSLSPSELEYMKSQDVSTIADTLKTVVTSGRRCSRGSQACEVQIPRY